ncbi:homocysteine S-methyltransferase [Fictibacillus fluitans]|uniref:Homocysteine S-methyltransferase n=1 Tax=Fictibacillus fluitans TaxID=3058422 RepID=A0ABT8I293_9BACL|nr:homocysteine S-methyltransferase [Fictibacillus sp. NE201]MDN4527156.1 homocysteine S-methyltransferase [Fictibacillus sp. NE201]
MPKKSNPIDTILKNHSFVVLDGALATELERYGCNLDDPLWSASILLEKPELIYQVHEDYFKAGADVAITASYQATLDGFLSRGLAEQEAIQLIQHTVELAKKARDDFWKEESSDSRPKPIVAASVGPYGAYLADGSEYKGNYGVSDETLEQFHRPRIKALIEAGADVLAVETIPSLQEAKVVAKLLKEYPETYAWLSFSLSDGTTISEGTSLKECAENFNENEQIAAIGVNCAPSSVAADAVAELHKHTEKPIIVYPNSGETYDPETKTWSGTASCEGDFHLAAEDWYRAGARIIGGCCRTEPKQIKKLAEKRSEVERVLL